MDLNFLLKTWQIIRFSTFICAKFSNWITFFFFSKFNILSSNNLILDCYSALNITANHLLPVITSATESWRDGDKAKFIHAFLAVHKQRDRLSVKVRFPINKTLDTDSVSTTARDNWSVKWDQYNRCRLLSVTSNPFWVEDRLVNSCVLVGGNKRIKEVWFRMTF